MRVLCSFLGGSGHFDPLVPFAEAVRDAGHTVAFACRPAMTARVESAGFTVFATGRDGVNPRTMQPLLELSGEREDNVLRHGFAGAPARERAAAIVTLCRDWQPDVVMRDEVDFGAAIAAQSLGLPCVSVIVIAEGSFIRAEVVAEPLDVLRAGFGLAPDPSLMTLTQPLVLSTVPPSFRNPAFPLPPTASSFRLPREVRARDDGDVTGEWPGMLDGAPLVYFTLGTVFNIESGDLFPRVLVGLRTLPVNVIATVGQQIDPTAFGAMPAQVRIERFIPQAKILARCDLMVCHGGSGSVVGALANGVPMVLLPMGADQPMNARRCAELGVGRTVDALTATPASIAAAVAAMLADDRARTAARRFSAETARLPDVREAVPLIERLVSPRR